MRFILFFALVLALLNVTTAQHSGTFQQFNKKKDAEMKKSGQDKKRPKSHIDDMTKRAKKGPKGEGQKPKDAVGLFGLGGVIGPGSGMKNPKTMPPKKDEMKKKGQDKKKNFSNTMYLYYETKAASDEQLQKRMDIAIDMGNKLQFYFPKVGPIKMKAYHGKIEQVIVLDFEMEPLRNARSSYEDYDDLVENFVMRLLQKDSSIGAYAFAPKIGFSKAWDKNSAKKTEFLFWLSFNPEFKLPSLYALFQMRKAELKK